MSTNTDYDSAYVAKVTCSTSDSKVDLLLIRKYFTLVADADCFVNFDKAVTTAGRFLVKANTPFTFESASGVSTLHYLGAAGTENLYIYASR